MKSLLHLTVVTSLQRNGPKPWQAFVGKALQHKNYFDYHLSENFEYNQTFNARSGKHCGRDNQPVGPESKIARLAGERFRVYLETSACFKWT